jgi:membrane-associated protein
LTLETLKGFDFIIAYRYAGVFCIVLLYATGFASIIPGRSVIVLLGVLCQGGYLNFYLTAIIAVVASIIGANIGYIVGRYTIGEIIARRDRFLFISKAKLERGTSIGRQYGAKLIIPAMFVGGFWLLTSVIPGMVKMKYSIFATINASGLIVWVISLMTLGYFGGYLWSNNLVSKSYIILIIAVVIAIIFIIRKLVFGKVTGDEQ